MSDHHAHHPVASADVSAHPEGGHEADALPLRFLYMFGLVSIVTLVGACLLWADMMQEFALTATDEQVAMTRSAADSE